MVSIPEVQTLALTLLMNEQLITLLIWMQPVLLRLRWHAHVEPTTGVVFMAVGVITH